MGWIRDEMMAHRASLEPLVGSHGDLYRWARKHKISHAAAFAQFKRELQNEFGVLYDDLKSEAKDFKAGRVLEAIRKGAEMAREIPSDAEFRWKMFAEVALREDGVGLLSDWFGDTWFESGHPMVATCLKRDHDAPHVDCGCGIWAFDDLQRVSRLPRKGRAYYPLAIARVAQWGRTYEDDGATRSEFACPTDLYTGLTDRIAACETFGSVHPISEILETVDLGFCPGCSGIWPLADLNTYDSIPRPNRPAYGPCLACRTCLVTGDL